MYRIYVRADQATAFIVVLSRLPSWTMSIHETDTHILFFPTVDKIIYSQHKISLKTSRVESTYQLVRERTDTPTQSRNKNWVPLEVSNELVGVHSEIRVENSLRCEPAI